ncbi:MAG: DUF2142 domain-containing protein [Chloroflexi bacterium]|nr:DUF2142 domain-containing protein [Chloroflexota bacterium]
MALLFLGLGTAYALAVPPYNAPDEPAHVNYVRELATRGALPVLQPGDWDAAALAELTARRFPADRPVHALRYEGHQPPLYYLLAAPLAWALGGLPDWQQAIALRFWSLLLGLGTLWLTCRLVDALFPASRLLRLAVPAFVALLPMYLHVSASVNNDALATVLIAAALAAGADALREPTRLRPWVLGLLGALAVLTKLTAYVVVPLVLLVLACAPQRRQRRAWLAVLLPPAVALALWSGRNALVYGWHDPLGLARHAVVVVGQPHSEQTWRGLWRFVRVTFQSFWAQFGWMGLPIDERAYLLLAALSALAALGLALWLWRALRRGRAAPFADGRQALLIAAAALLVFGAMAAYNWTYDQPQGRYLFAALPAWASLWCLGLAEALAPAARPVIFAAFFAGLVALNLLALLVWMPAYFGGG